MSTLLLFVLLVTVVLAVNLAGLVSGRHGADVRRRLRFWSALVAVGALPALLISAVAMFRNFLSPDPLAVAAFLACAAVVLGGTLLVVGTAVWPGHAERASRPVNGMPNAAAGSPVAD
jgi:hypothetical protein